jgi:hypothetical protein
VAGLQGVRIRAQGSAFRAAGSQEYSDNDEGQESLEEGSVTNHVDKIKSLKVLETFRDSIKESQTRRGR